ncbi:MAG: hypothetical protein N2490_05275 [Ignavibacteria bacterium]|nr:hypothetical protein [Ignavibacteria bacterium]
MIQYPDKYNKTIVKASIKFLLFICLFLVQNFNIVYSGYLKTLTIPSILLKDTTKPENDIIWDIKKKSSKFIPYIKIIGHSWAVGAFKGQEEYFKMNGIIIDETSKVGTSIKWATQQLDSVAENKFDAIVLLSGINDYKNSVQEIADDFVKFMEKALTKAPVVFVFNIPYYEPAAEKIAIINDWLWEMSKLNNEIIVIDLYSEIEAQKKDGLEMSKDGLHLKNYDCVMDLLIYYIKYYYDIK